MGEPRLWPSEIDEMRSRPSNIVVDAAQVEGDRGSTPLGRNARHFRKHGWEWLVDEIENESEASEFKQACSKSVIIPEQRHKH